MREAGKKKVGRPDSYDYDKARSICVRIANGELLVHARDSLQRSFSGFAIGSLLGIALGVRPGGGLSVHISSFGSAGLGVTGNARSRSEEAG